jgi:hypothetical protein
LEWRLIDGSRRRRYVILLRITRVVFG